LELNSNLCGNNFSIKNISIVETLKNSKMKRTLSILAMAGMLANDRLIFLRSRMCRGGSSYASVAFCQIDNKFSFLPSMHSFDLGFRVTHP